MNDASTLDLTTAMTLEAWVFPTASTDWRTALLKETTGGLVYGLYGLRGHAAPGELAPSQRRRKPGSPAPGVIALNTWTHLAATYGAGTLTLFVNGVPVATRALPGSLTTSNGALRIGGNTIWGEYFQGSIDEVRIYGRVLAQAEIQADMTTPVGGTPLPDTEPPVVSISAPANGAIFGGTVTVSANASDDVAVTGVQFLLDGGALGQEDLSAPFSIAWDTRLAADGIHVISARAPRRGRQYGRRQRHHRARRECPGRHASDRLGHESVARRDSDGHDQRDGQRLRQRRRRRRAVPAGRCRARSRRHVGRRIRRRGTPS